MSSINLSIMIKWKEKSIEKFLKKLKNLNKLCITSLTTLFSVLFNSMLFELVINN